MSGPRISSYGLNDSTGPFSPDQTNGGATTAAFTIVGSGATYSSGRLNIPAGTYLPSPMAPTNGIRAGPSVPGLSGGRPFPPPMTRRSSTPICRATR